MIILKFSTKYPTYQLLRLNLHSLWYQITRKKLQVLQLITTCISPILFTTSVSQIFRDKFGPHLEFVDNFCFTSICVAGMYEASICVAGMYKVASMLL